MQNIGQKGLYNTVMDAVQVYGDVPMPDSAQMPHASLAATAKAAAKAEREVGLFNILLITRSASAHSLNPTLADFADHPAASPCGELSGHHLLPSVAEGK